MAIEYLKGELQQGEKVLYPHTTADVVELLNGQTAEEKFAEIETSFESVASGKFERKIVESGQVDLNTLAAGSWMMEFKNQGGTVTFLNAPAASLSALMQTEGADRIRHQVGFSAAQNKMYMRSSYLDSSVIKWNAWTELITSQGGTINGIMNLNNGRYNVNQWGAFSAGTDGFVLLAQNAYKDPNTNVYKYTNTHESMGARGIIFRHGAPGVWWFDTGMVATQADQEFTPTFKSLTRPDAELITGQDLNNVRQNGTYCGSGMSNAPHGSADWWYVFVQNLTDNGNNYCVQQAFAVDQQAFYARTLRNGVWQPWERIITEAGGNITGNLTIISNGGSGLQLVGTDHVYIPIYKNGQGSARSGYIGYTDGAATELTINNEISGSAVAIKAQGGLKVNNRKVPAYYAATWAPLNTDGEDGDVWDVYV